jgi:site-specific DNA-methyltransferase (adenine-specific)
MTPFYQEPGITIYHGDCREILPCLPPADVLITDPPYLTRNAQVPIGGPHIAPISYESLSVGSPWGYDLEWLTLKHAKHWVLWCNYQMIASLCIAMEKIAKLSSIFVWRKLNAPHMTRPVPRLDCEFILWFRHVSASYRHMGHFKSMVIDVPMPQAGCIAHERILLNGTKKAAHPTQKPLAIVQPFVQCLDPSDLLDPFMGTGTTLVAAKKLGIQATGIEIEEYYCELAVKRLQQQVLSFADVVTPASRNGHDITQEEMVFDTRVC